MRRTLIAVIAAAAAVAVAGGSSGAAQQTALVSIRHQTRGCHTWSVNGGSYTASHALRLTRGSTVRFVNFDVMPHTLVVPTGSAIRLANGNAMPMGRMHGAAAPGVMNHMGATTTATFTKPGTYTLITKAGEDYMSGFETVGRDNVLELTVAVR
jgi:plastocyanin